MLYLQAYDLRGGNSVPYQHLDYTRLIEWLRTIRGLGVTTLVRWSTAPEIPPLNEAGVPGFDAAGWFMVSGPAGTPQPIVERLHNDLKAIMGSPDVQQAVNRTGVVPVVSPPLAELPKFIATEKERWGKVVAQAGLAGTQ